MKKGIVALLLLTVLLLLAPAAMGMAYREFTWNDYTLTMEDVRELAQGIGTVQPPEGKTFLQVTLRLPEELMQNAKMRGQLFFVLLQDRIPLHNTFFRLNTQENLYACVFTLPGDFRLEEYELSVSGAQSAEIDPPDEESALSDELFSDEADEWVTGLDQRI